MPVSKKIFEISSRKKSVSGTHAEYLLTPKKIPAFEFSPILFFQPWRKPTAHSEKSFASDSSHCRFSPSSLMDLSVVLKGLWRRAILVFSRLRESMIRFKFFFPSEEQG